MPGESDFTSPPPSQSRNRAVQRSPEAPKRRRGRPAVLLLASGVLTISMVSAGVGAVVALRMTGEPSDATVAAAQAPPGARSPAGSVEQVAARVLPSVVELETRTGDMTAEGSGVVLSADGLILTNNHVVSRAVGAESAGYGGAATTRVTFNNGRTVPFTVVGADPVTDIAVVQARGVSGLTPITLGSSSQLRVGQRVVAVGSPLGLQGTVTDGVISALHRPVQAGKAGRDTDFDAIQTDAPINPGNSGGALVDMNGRLIGLNSAIATLGAETPTGESGSIGLGFAIPVDQAKRIADQLVTTGTAAHAALGVQTVDDPSVDGAEVVAVLPGSPAAAAGLPSGVVVTKLDDQLIASSTGLVAAVHSQAPGDTVTLSYRDRSGATGTVRVTLGTQRAQPSVQQ